MNRQDKKVEDAVAALKQAVAATLARKKKLGEYAIVNRDGKPYEMPASELPDEMTVNH